MSNLADLKVGLLLNDVSFRTQIADAYRHAGSESERFSRKVNTDNKKSEESFASLSKSIHQVAGKIALISGTGLSLGAIINTTRQYSQSLSDLAAITGATGAQMKLFDEAAQEMGRTTQFSAMQGAEAIKLMASAKPDLMKTSTGLIDVTKSALILAQASGTTLPEATRTLALSLNQFGASAAETDRYINVLAAGAKYGSSEVNETSEAIKKSGVAAANTRVSFEALNAAIQTLAEREVKGSDAGTALRNMILKLEASADKNLKPSVVGLGGALENLGKKNYSTTALTKLFGIENVNTAMILSKNADKVKELTQALTGTDTAFEQAKERTNNLNGDLQGLSAAFEGMAIKVGQTASGPLRAGINTTTDAVNALAGNLNTVIDVAAYGLIPLLGGRLSKGLQDQTTAWYDIQKASKAASVQMRDTAIKGIADASEQLKSLTIQGESLTDHSLKMKEFDMQTFDRGRERYKLDRLETEAINQKIKYTRELEAANNRLSYSQRALAGTTNILKGAYAAIGGPVGAAMLAGSALYYFHNKAVEARQSALSLKDAVVETTAELMKLSKIKLTVDVDNLEGDLDNLVEQQEIISSKLERYSDIKITGLKNRSDGWLGLLYENPDDAIKEKNALLSQLEDIEQGIEKTKERISRRKGILSGETIGSNNPPEPDSGGSTGTNELTPKSKSGNKTLNQYQQLRHQIEAEHAVSLERISLSETETLRKLQESYKAGGMKQGEFERLKTLNAENHMKQRAELAEKYSPVRSLIRSEQEANKELKSLLDARLLSDKEYHHATMRLAQDSAKNRLSEQAKGIALPNISILGEIDPVIQLKNQLEEQRALYEAFYQNGVVSKERYEQLMTAASNRSKEAQLQASKELYAAQGNWQRMQVNLFESIEQRMGNSLTGMITGSKSFSESLQDISASLAQSIIQDLVRIAMQALITNALTGLMGGLAGGAATSGAAAGASSSASGAGAMGMPTSWKGYSRGGYTGNKGINEISGVVHGQEYVFDAETTKSIGVENLESIRKNGTGRTINNPNFGMNEFKGVGSKSGSNTVDNSQMNKIEIYQTIQVSGNGDQALMDAMQQAARSGAKQGSDDAIARIHRDFQSNGNIRKTLGR
ncbi:phage tail tape measure protein [Providencia heimbachae]|uniref:phage tail tape measure protein n=1 Tax=Providencia heimbachae TaxID=333962 RepID=UPI00223EBCC6|nr:phage tail tape measure protein [Providencia heimbachae]